MIVRATNKLLKLSKNQPAKDELGEQPSLPGEWFANTLKTGQAGKTYLLFYHKQTKIAFVFQTKSLKIALEELPKRLSDLLDRLNLKELYRKFEIDSDIHLLNTNCRSTLGYMNKLADTYNWHFYDLDLDKKFDDIFFEDIALDYLYKKIDNKYKYEYCRDILSKLKI